MFSSPSIVIGRGHPTAQADVVAPRNAAAPRKFKYLIALCSSGWSGASAHVHIALPRRVRRAEGCQQTRIELTHLGFDKASAFGEGIAIGGDDQRLQVRRARG